VDADSATPYFNSGFVIFQNCAHQRIRSSWRRFTRHLMEGQLPDPGLLNGTHKYAEQVALSLAISAVGLSYYELDKKEWT